MPKFRFLALLVASAEMRLRSVGGFPISCYDTRRRRRLAHSGDDNGNGNDFGSCVARCDHLDYDLHLAIGIHFSLYAEPVASANGNND